jgi:Peptidase S46.
MDAVNDILSRSFLANSSEARNILEKGKEEILSKKDPFIEFILDTRESLSQTRKLYEKLTKEEELYVQQLGNAIFEVYGTSIPPDATFTLRISDGVIKSYEYNGTIAPPKTTFYGLYDRFYSFKKKYPWNLPERWLNPPVEFNLETPFNFISTNDITGGNSGSPVINSKAELSV